MWACVKYRGDARCKKASVRVPGRSSFSQLILHEADNPKLKETQKHSVSIVRPKNQSSEQIQEQIVLRVEWVETRDSKQMQKVDFFSHPTPMTEAPTRSEQYSSGLEAPQLPNRNEKKDPRIQTIRLYTCHRYQSDTDIADHPEPWSR